MLGGNESIDNFALSLQIRVAIRNEADGALCWSKSDEFVKIGFADEELVFCSFNRNRNQPGFDFGRCPNGIGHIDSGPPREVLDSRRRLGPEVLCSELSEGFLHPQVEWIGLRQEVGRQYQRVRRGIQPLLGLLLDQLSFFLQKIDRQ